MIDWSKTTYDEMRMISAIAYRAVKLAAASGFRLEHLDVEMDVTAANGTCRLDLERLLGFKDSDFMHDVTGIRRHLDRETGELRDCFVPRCAVPESDKETPI